MYFTYVFKSLLCCLSLILLLGCDGVVSNFVDGARRSPIVPIPENLPQPILFKAAYLENVSAGAHFQTTQLLGYKVRQSAGLVPGKQVSQTPSGYKIYLNVTGRLTSEEIN